MPIHPTPPREANSPLALGKPQRFWALLPLHGLRGLAGLKGWDRGRGVSGCTVGKTNLTTVRCSQGSACLKTPSLQKRPQGRTGLESRDFRALGKPMRIQMAEQEGAQSCRGRARPPQLSLWQLSGAIPLQDMLVVPCTFLLLVVPDPPGSRSHLWGHKGPMCHCLKHLIIKRNGHGA